MNWYERAIRAYLAGAPELLKAEYRDSNHPLAGHCYVASEAYYHAQGGSDSGLSVWHINHENESHWFLRDGETIIDLTVDQFTRIPKYEEATRKGFLTRGPSKRARAVLSGIPDAVDFTRLDTSNITTVGVDVDGVLGEQVAPVMEYTNETYDTDFPRMVTGRNPVLSELNREFVSLLREARESLPDYYGSMPVIPGSKAALGRLSEDYTIVIVTHRPAEDMTKTKEWLDENGFVYDEFLTPVPENKAEAEVDILIDDFYSNVSDFLTADKPAVQFVRPNVLDDESLVPSGAWTAASFASFSNLATSPACQWQAIVDEFCA